MLSCGGGSISIAEKVVRESFSKVLGNKAFLPHKTILNPDFSNGQINIMPCSILKCGNPIFGVKLIGMDESNKIKNIPYMSSMIVLFNGETKEPLTVISGDAISAYRTAAVTSLISRYTLKNNLKNVLLLGAGPNMKVHVVAMNQYFKENKEVSIGVYSRGDSKNLFVREMQKRISGNLWAIGTLSDDIIANADLIIGCVPNLNINEAPIKNAHLKEGVTFFNIGLYDCDVDTVASMDRIIVDSWDAVKSRGDQPITDAYNKGVIKDKGIESIMPFIVNNKRIRKNDKEKILVVPVGFGTHDVLFAYYVYKNALEKKIGRKFQLSDLTSYV